MVNKNIYITLERKFAQDKTTTNTLVQCHVASVYLVGIFNNRNI